MLHATSRTAARPLFAALLALSACAGDAPSDPLADPALASLLTSPTRDDGGLTNVSADLRAVMEDGAIFGACDRWDAGETDRETTLLCGKYLFFYGTFRGAGPPMALMEFLGSELPATVGAGFSGVGQFPDPFSDTGMPIGWAFSYDAALPDGDPAPIAAMTCAGCHVGQLPDGRYAVGAPNTRFDYGKQLLLVSLLPRLLSGEPASMHAPEAVAEVQAALDAFDADKRARFLTALLPILDAGITPPAAVDHDVERAQAGWTPGTLDTFMAPLEPDDGVDIPTRIMALWELASAEEQAVHGMPHAMLGWAGGSDSVAGFVDFFVTWFGDREAWPLARQRPLVEFLMSLRRPEPPAPTDPAAVARGAALFVEAGCLDCHGGPRGGSTRTFGFDEIGSDAQLARFMDPDGDGEPCCGLGAGSGGPGLSQGVKAPRLVGLWAQPRLLHNGAVAGLDGLFCVDAERPTVTTPGYGDGGHLDLCERFSADEKAALIAFLETL